MRAIGKLLLATAAALALAGCPAAHGDYPTRACMIDSDCYEHEHCNTVTTTCVADTMTAVDQSAAPQDQGPTTGDDQ